MDKKTGKFTTKIRKHMRAWFAAQPNQTILLNDLLEAEYKRNDLELKGSDDGAEATSNPPSEAQKED